MNPNDFFELPEGHREVIELCVNEAWANLDQGDAVTLADVASDIVRRLTTAYSLEGN